MSDELIVVDSSSGDIQVHREPQLVLNEAQKAAKALNDVISKKKKPVIMNGEQYLEFEDWQTVGRFYGITAKIISTQHVVYGEVQGFEARAIALRADGAEISAADAMCLNDEPNWKSKPMFQLRSMAQTRACAKALRNVLAWVVVLAGYKPTPAEEIKDMISDKPTMSKPDVKLPQEAPQDAPRTDTKVIDADTEAFQGVFTAINAHTGKKGDREWTRYDFTISNQTISTFDKKLVEKVEHLINAHVIAHFKREGRFMTAVSIEPEAF